MSLPVVPLAWECAQHNAGGTNQGCYDCAMERLAAWERLEWIGGFDDDGDPCIVCPACHRYQRFGHLAGCWIAAMLGREVDKRPEQQDAGLEPLAVAIERYVAAENALAERELDDAMREHNAKNEPTA